MLDHFIKKTRFVSTAVINYTTVTHCKTHATVRFKHWIKGTSHATYSFKYNSLIHNIIQLIVKKNLHKLPMISN